MKRKQMLSFLGIMLFVACSLAAQEKPGTIAALEFQKPKNGMLPQYQAGRKEKAAWHKQQTTLNHCWYGKYSAATIQEPTWSAGSANTGRI